MTTILISIGAVVAQCLFTNPGGRLMVPCQVTHPEIYFFNICLPMDNRCNTHITYSIETTKKQVPLQFATATSIEHTLTHTLTQR